MALGNHLADKGLLTAASVLYGVAAITIGVLTILWAISSGGVCACTTPPPKFVFEENTTGNATTVHITSNRGDFRAHTLSVAVDGNTTEWTTHGTATGRLGNDTAVVTGDTHTVTGVESGTEIRVLWTPENQNESQEMSTYVVGEE